jgi:hypothetical protein
VQQDQLDRLAQLELKVVEAVRALQDQLQQLDRLAALVTLVRLDLQGPPVAPDQQVTPGALIRPALSGLDPQERQALAAALERRAQLAQQVRLERPEQRAIS